MSDDLIEHHKRECNRYVNGACTTAACLRRGGWKPGGIQNVDAATCVAHETAIALAAKDAEIERLQERLEMTSAYVNGKLMRVPAGSIPDGISCRNETIKLLHANIAALRARLARAEAERDAANKELRILLDACEASPWHPIKTGEMVKRILVAESALVRMRTHFAALDATKEKNDGEI